MRVEIYSDVVCPWCYIGKRRFEQALAEFPGRDDVEVVWRPYQLDQTAPTAPSPVIDTYARKFGGPVKAMQIVDQLTATAASEGLDFHLEIAQRANTFDAHRVLWLAEQLAGPAAQGRIKERLLRAYFSEGADVADRATLTRLAADAGLDGAAVAAMLASDQGIAEVREDMARGMARGVTAVPTFVIDGRWGIPGAQDPSTFLRVLEHTAEAERSERSPQ